MLSWWWRSVACGTQRELQVVVHRKYSTVSSSSSQLRPTYGGDAEYHTPRPVSLNISYPSLVLLDALDPFLGRGQADSRTRSNLRRRLGSARFFPPGKKPSYFTNPTRFCFADVECRDSGYMFPEHRTDSRGAVSGGSPFAWPCNAWCGYYLTLIGVVYREDNAVGFNCPL